MKNNLEYQENTELETAKHTAIEKFIMDLQRQSTELERDIEHKSYLIEELCDKDWARNMEMLKVESSLLQRLVSEKDLELSNIQRYASGLFNYHDKNPN